MLSGVEVPHPPHPDEHPKEPSFFVISRYSTHATLPKAAATIMYVIIICIIINHNKSEA